jgi:hypothetical protein
MLSGAALRKQVRTCLVDRRRDVDASSRIVELLLAQFDEAELVVGHLADDAVLFAHYRLQCCAGCDAVFCHPGSVD